LFTDVLLKARKKFEASLRTADICFLFLLSSFFFLLQSLDKEDPEKEIQHVRALTIALLCRGGAF